MAVEGGTKRPSSLYQLSSGYESDSKYDYISDEEEHVKPDSSHETDHRPTYANDQTEIMEKKKRFLRPSSFIGRRKSTGTKVDVKPIRTNENFDVESGNQHLEQQNDAFEQCKRLKTELETTNDKVDQFQTEVELLRSQLRSVYRKELKASENLSANLDYESDVPMHGAIKPADIRPNISTIASCSDGDIDPSEHHTRPCKECEKLLLTRVSALVEAITLRRYVLQLSKMTEKAGEEGTEAFLSENERKLTKTLAEKELLARQLKSVIRERDKILLERDRALEEWEKAASKWETTLDQLDTLMIQQNEAKERDNKTIARLRSYITELEGTIKQKEQVNDERRQKCAEMEQQLSISKKETKDCINEHDVVLKANFNIAQELRRVNGELNETRTKCAELESSSVKAQTLIDRNKANSEHMVKQWKYAVKEKKKLQRDISGIVQSRNEAIQRNLSTLSQLDRVREERDKLARRVRDQDGNGDISDISETQCSLADCQFCTEHAGSTNGKSPSYDEINVSISKSVISEANLSLEHAIIGGHSTLMVTNVDDVLVKHHNVRKYDDVVAVNQQNVVGADVAKVRRMITERQSDLNLTLRRYKTPCDITLETEIPIPKKSKLGCGIHWGVYIKDLSTASLAKESGHLEIGDYINMINGKNLTKILSSALDKYSRKRGDKMSVEITRKLSPSVWKCPCHYNAIRKLNILSRDKYPNRDSVISIESNQSLGASSISSIPSYISSIDSASICSPMASESEAYLKTDRKPTEVYSIETGVPPTIAEESSTDGSIFHSKSLRVRSLTHIGKPKYMKKDSHLPRAQSLTYSLNSPDNSLKRRSVSRSSGPFCSNGSVVSVKQVHPVAATVKPVMFTVPVSRERTRVVRLDKRSGESLGLKINGGNCVGIYVTGFCKQSLAEEAGVRVGDRLLQLNSYTLTQVTLDYATRIVRMLGTCNYIRMEVQNYSNIDDVLKEGTLDSLCVRARISHSAKLANELNYNIGDKLRVTNTRADYDPLKQTWRWFAVRERPADNGAKEQGLIPAMNYSPEANSEPHSPTKSGPTTKDSETEDGVFSDDSLRNGYHRKRRNSVERLSHLRRYRGSKLRSSVESLASETDSQSENRTINYYEILQEKQV